MTSIFAKQALLPDGWHRDVMVSIGNDGRIANIVHQPEKSMEDCEQVSVLLPAPVNVHSHSFQRAMAGLTEQRGNADQDSFWTWRKLMYRFLDQLSPKQVEAITAFVQMEMLEAGYATNVEFHYLHHQQGGHVYDDLSEMSQRIIAAAKFTGIGLTLLPVHYQYGRCDQRGLGEGQIRFGNDIDQFSLLLESVRGHISKSNSDFGIGVAPHSLRAVSPADLPALQALAKGDPIHIHLAEQIAEVEEIQQAWGARPVEYLLDNADVDASWCLIHCTQMLSHETNGLAKTNAVAGLCPLTEASLGDGMFDGVNWLDQGGRIAIGSDSNIHISLAHEIRALEYSQRLRDHTRAALATSHKSTARRIFDEICTGGAQASGRECGKISVGSWADLLALDDRETDLYNRKGDALLDGFVFAAGQGAVKEVWSAGRHQVKDGQHVNREKIVTMYHDVIMELGQEI